MFKLIILFAALAACSSRTSRPELVRSEPLPPPVREALHDRMIEHGDDMESLLWSALMLDHETAASIAERIAETPRIAGGTAGLPPRFFDYQDQLHDGAAALRRAALARDDAAIGREFARISGACIGCHSLYLQLPPVPEK